jgi:hypothetical protein
VSALLGRLLQLSALILLPIAHSYGLLKDQVRTEVKLLALGAFLFLLGRILSRER